MTVDIGDLKGLTVEPPFGMSHSGGSGFKVSAIGECPRKAALKLLGWRKKLSKEYFGYGNILHRHALGPYTSTPIPVDPEKMASEVKSMVWDEVYTAEYVGNDCQMHTEQVPIEPVSDNKRESLPEMALMHAKVWDEMRYNAKDALACEMLMTSAVQDPDTGNVPSDLDGVKILGRVDLTVQINGVPAIRDIKTTASPLSTEWTQNLDYHRQLSTYRYLWMSQFNQNIMDTAAWQLTKHKTEKSIRKYAGEVPLDRPLRFTYIFEEFVDAYRQIKAHEKLGQWPKNPCACSGKFFPCEFVPICYADQFDNPEQWQETLHRKEQG